MGSKSVGDGLAERNGRVAIPAIALAWPGRTKPRTIAPGARVAGGFAAAYCTVLIMLKIGRYIAMIMPPTMPPSTTIMIGSIAARRFSTAASTSSS